LTIWGSGSVIFSRLYNGYHSPLDVAGGATVGLLFTTVWYFFLRYWLDKLLMWNSFFAPVLAFLIHFAMILLHPRPTEPTPALPESGMLFGAAAGNVIGSQMNTLFDVHAILGTPPTSFWLEFIRSSSLVLSVTRFMFGMIIVMLVRAIGKMVFTHIIKQIYPDEKDANWVVTLVKFFNYFVISLFISFGIIAIFHLVGLQQDYDLHPVSPFPTGFPV